MSVRRDDNLAKCFHPACGRFITPFQIDKAYGIQKMLMEVYHDFHCELMKKNPNPCPAYKYLTDERKIHPKVVIDSMIGVVPRDYDIDSKFQKIIDDAKELSEKNKGERTEKRGRPKKDSFSLEKYQQYIEDTKEKWKKAVLPGFLAFFYLDQFYRITLIRLRRPYTRDFSLFKPSSSKEVGLFGHQLFSPLKLPEEDGSEQTEKLAAMYSDLNKRMIVTEGEFNSLQLQSLWVRVAEGRGITPDYLFACSVGGAQGVDYNCIKAVSKQPIFCYDKDTAGRHMVSKAQDFMNISAFTVPDSYIETYKDIDDYIRSFKDDHEGAFSKIKNLLNDRKPFFRTFESVASEIRTIRHNSNDEENKMLQFEIFTTVAEIVKNDLLERGTFYFNDNAAYIFFNLEKRLVHLHKEDNEYIKLLAGYRLMPSENIYNYILDYLQTEAVMNGTKTEIHRFAYFDKERYVLYVFNHNNQIYRISNDSIELIDNGAEQVLFLSDPQTEPFQINLPIKIDNSGSQLYEELIDKINFEEDILTVNERKLLFRYYFLSLFFESLMPTKIISCFVGEKGSGKSITLRKIGMLLFGSRFDVKSLPGNEDDFDVIALNSYLFFIDNADTKCAWLDDRIARIATGAVISRRELYTTAKLFSQSAKCFLGITSRTPHFRRDDIADRLLLMTVKRFDEFVPASAVLTDIMKKRNQILTETFYLLQRAVKAHKKWKNVQESGGFRMTDFYSFAIKIAREDGHEEQLFSIFTKLTKEQSLFTLGADVIFDLISEWVNLRFKDSFGKITVNSERELNSNELNQELANLAEQKNIAYPYKEKPRAFAQRLSNIVANLREFFAITVREGRGRVKLYSFCLKKESEDNPHANEILPF